MIEVNKLGKNYILALKKKYESEMLEAEANLALYVTNLSAIGEHSDLLEEHDKWVEKWVNAKDKLEAVNQIFDLSESI
jgi:hypothetical protein